MRCISNGDREGVGLKSWLLGLAFAFSFFLVGID